MNKFLKSYEKLRFIFRAYKHKYRNDFDEICYMTSKLREDDVVIEIGAYKGSYLYWIKKKLLNTGKIYAFEPQPKLYEYLGDIKKLLRLENLTIEKLALSSEVGASILYIPKNEKGYSQLSRMNIHSEETKYKKIAINTTTLDKYFLENYIYPNFIKIDAEGHEMEILLGGISLIKRCSPLILMECETRHLKDGDIFDVFKILLNLGYNGFFFEKGKMKSIDLFNPTIHQKEIDRLKKSNKYINNFVFEINNN